MLPSHGQLARCPTTKLTRVRIRCIRRGSSECRDTTPSRTSQIKLVNDLVDKSAWYVTLTDSQHSLASIHEPTDPVFLLAVVSEPSLVTLVESPCDRTHRSFPRARFSVRWRVRKRSSMANKRIRIVHTPSDCSVGRLLLRRPPNRRRQSRRVGSRSAQRRRCPEPLSTQFPSSLRPKNSRSLPQVTLLTSVGHAVLTSSGTCAICSGSAGALPAYSGRHP